WVNHWVLQRSNGLCCFCEKKIGSRTEHTLEHIIEFASDQRHDMMGNLLSAHKKCNQDKGSKSLDVHVQGMVKTNRKFGTVLESAAVKKSLAKSPRRRITNALAKARRQSTEGEDPAAKHSQEKVKKGKKGKKGKKDKKGKR
ncbi:hypothetical protein HDU89_001145, partial [Geranomyces variabilis]